MARLFTAGFESQIASTTGTQHGETDGGVVSITTNGTANFDTTVKRSGEASRSFAQGAANFENIGGLTTLDRAYFVRGYFRFSDAAPSTAADIIIFRANSINVGFVRLNTGGTLTLRDTSGQIGSPSATLANDTWYRVEAKIIIPTASTGTLELKLDGTTVASSSTAAVNNSVATASFRLGNVQNGEAGVTTYLDDVAVNDDQGSAQTSYPGAGKVVVLWPASHNAIGTWVGPQTTGDDTTNLEQNVDNRPPTGVAHADDDATAGKQVFNVTNSANQDFDLNTDTYSTAGVTGSDVVKVVQGFARMSVNSTTGTNTAGIEVTSNPAISISTGKDLETTAVAGTEPAGWKTFKTAPSYSPSVTLGSAAVIRARKVDASTRANLIDQMGVLVEYAPSVALGDVSSTDTEVYAGTLGAEPSTSTYGATTLGAASSTATYPP